MGAGLPWGTIEFKEIHQKMENLNDSLKNLFGLIHPLI